jgi:hypothetical protein
MSLSVISEFEETPQAQIDAPDDSQNESPSDAPNDDVTPEPRSDARADVPISETSERFLRALLNKVPIDRIEELYLFAPLRQGAVETGIAVVAARASVVLPPVVPLVPTDVSPYAPEVAADTIIDADTRAEAEAAAETHVGIDDDIDADGDADIPFAFAQHEEAYDVHPPVRHTVYTARYRLVVKGPDRGKWEIDVVDEADAPLLAVETVVRGVQRRAGEETATVRYTASQLARALRLSPQETP